MMNSQDFTLIIRILIDFFLYNNINYQNNNDN